MEKPKLSISFPSKTGASGHAATANKLRQPSSELFGEPGTLESSAATASSAESQRAPAVPIPHSSASIPHSSASILHSSVSTSRSPDPQPAAAQGTAWLQAGLVVRVMERELAQGRYFRRTGIVKRVVERWGGDVQLEDGDIIRLDQEDCETVPPAPEQAGLIVSGPYADTRAKVIRREGGREVEVELEEGARRGHRLLLPTSQISRHIAIRE